MTKSDEIMSAKKCKIQSKAESSGRSIQLTRYLNKTPGNNDTPVFIHIGKTKRKSPPTQQF